MKVSQIVHYGYAGEIYQTEQEALNHQKFVQDTLGKRLYLLSTKPDLRDGLGYYEKEIVIVNDLPNFKKHLENLSTTVPESANAYSLEGPYFFEKEKDLAEFLSMKYSVGIGRYATTKRLSVRTF